MIQSINAAQIRTQKMSMASDLLQVKNTQAATNNSYTGWTNKASDAIKMNNFNLARTISFGASLGKAIETHTKEMITCGNEKVGEVVDVTSLLFDTQADRVIPGDTAKSNTMIGSRYVRNSAKAIGANIFKDTQDNLFEMTVRGDDATKFDQRSEHPVQEVTIKLTPVNKKGQGTKEEIKVLNTKGNKGDNFVATVQDDKNVLMTNAGSIIKKDQEEGQLTVIAKQDKNNFTPFVTKMDPVRPNKPMPSIGEGTEIVIGMENGRFVNEIKASIREFVEKIENEEIVLPQFVAAPNAKDVQLIMLAGGFGSRAEYANAISDRIINGTADGAISTKGVFRTATGLTPMETTLVTLHKAGLLDCSKGKIGIGRNIKFYLNQGQNRGNGEFSADLYASMPRPGRKYAMMFPNDSMSRMTNAVIEANKKMQTGEAAIAMVAKKVKAEDCINTFGIMKLADNGEILDFAEKPNKIDLYGKYAGFIDNEGMCLTNTFQFAVSDEAFQVLNMLEDLFIPKVDPKNGKIKESRDWSSQYVPIIKTLTQENDYETIKKQLAIALNNKPEAISDSIIAKSKALLGNQKIFAIPTAEPWADCGTLNALYDTTMKIVSGDFKLEDFERARAISCVDTQTGLIASSPEQKEEIESKYLIRGQVMAAKPAPKITDKNVADIPVVIHRD
ncbi:MAG: hypothetical protein IJB79_04355 [Candidatus Gastranaerophilales bacterium]|nr:hypothetical protein [Candidatus Gastranaerophilales bacterium]